MNTQSTNMKPMLAVGLAAVTFAALSLTAAMATKFGLLPPGAAQRIGLIAIGVVLIVTGNFVPKMRLFDRQGFPPARALAARRLTGWTLVLAGIAIAAFWIIAPNREMILPASLTGLVAFALIGGAWLWLKSGPREPVAPSEADDTIATAARGAMGWILFGLFWAFASIFAAYVWGDQPMIWMSVAYAIIIAVLPLLRPKRSR